MLNIALLSRWHPHASSYGHEFSAHSDVRVTVVWDEVPDRGRAWAEELGAEFVADYDQVLARADVDAICCTAPTHLHKELFLKAAAAKKHIYTEKVLAATKQEAIDIKEAVEAAGIKFCISFPMRTQPHILFAKKLIEEGVLGQINYLRVRNAHDGISGGWLPEHFKDPVSCGGGAMMDLGAHPMYLSSFLLGKPVKVSATFNKLFDTAIDDNCVAVIEFENKVIAVSETGFVTNSSPFTLELSGTKGTYISGGPDGKSWLKTSEKPSPYGGWMVPNLPREGLPSAISQFVNGVLNGGEIVFGIDDAIALSELMDGAYRSYHENRVVFFNEF